MVCLRVKCFLCVDFKIAWMFMNVYICRHQRPSQPDRRRIIPGNALYDVHGTGPPSSLDGSNPLQNVDEEEEGSKQGGTPITSPWGSIRKGTNGESARVRFQGNNYAPQPGITNTEKYPTSLHDNMPNSMHFNAWVIRTNNP